MNLTFSHLLRQRVADVQMQVRVPVEDRRGAVEFGIALVEDRLRQHHHAMLRIVGHDLLAQLLMRRIQVAEIPAAMQHDK